MNQGPCVMNTWTNLKGHLPPEDNMLKSSKNTWNCSSELHNSMEDPPWTPSSKLFWQNRLTRWWIRVSETHTGKILEDTCQKWGLPCWFYFNCWISIILFTPLHINICAYTYNSYIHNCLSHHDTMQEMCNFYHKLLPFFLLYKSGIYLNFVSAVAISWPSHLYNFLTFFFSLNAVVFLCWIPQIPVI